MSGQSHFDTVVCADSRCSLPVEIDTHITDELELPALIAWRDTSRKAYAHVESEFQSSLVKLVRHYVPDVDELLAVTDHYNGVIGGLAALAYIVRDFSLLSDTLDIAVGCERAAEMEDDLVRTQSLAFVEEIPPPAYTEDTTYRIFRTPNGRHIKLHISPTPSALMPIVRTPLTALYNYVTPRGFGCAYPLLTLARLTLITEELADEAAKDTTISQKQTSHATSLPGVSANAASTSAPKGAPETQHSGLGRELDTPLAVLRRLRGAGFWDDILPSSLLDPLAPRPCQDHPNASPHPCYRDLYLCPDQARYFGDRGSLVGFFDVAHASPEHMAKRQRPPFNPSVVWRFQSVETQCARTCISNDPMLSWRVRDYDCIVHPDMVRHGPRFIGDRTECLERLVSCSQTC